MTVTGTPSHLSAAERRALGREARHRVPLEAQAGWQPPPGRPDPVGLLEAQNATREPDLVPVRHGRMMVSAFTFYRGSAAIMAADLATRRTARLDVQLCGDAHLSNFGVYASPERQLLFDLNDFDETLPGPFEFDVWRLAASFVIAARHNQFEPSDVREICLTVGRSYREAMAEFAQQNTLDVWYARLSEDRAASRDEAGPPEPGGPGQGQQGPPARLGQTRGCVDQVGRGPAAEGTPPDQPAGAGQAHRGRRRKAAHRQPATRAHPAPRAREVLRAGRRRRRGHHQAVLRALQRDAERQPAAPARPLHDRRRRPQGRRRRLRGDPGLRGAAGGSRRERPPVPPGEGGDPVRPRGAPAQKRVRRLGPARRRGPAPAPVGVRHLPRLVRGHRDGPLLLLAPAQRHEGGGGRRGDDPGRHDLLRARSAAGHWPAHTRGSGDPVAIAAYLGRKRRFDKAVAEFAEHYAVQNDHDYEAFLDAISSGRIEAREGV